MPPTLIAGSVSTAVLAQLQASAAVTALVPAARIVDELPPRPLYPSVLVEGHGELPFNTIGAESDASFGSIATVGVRVLSQYRSDTEIHQIAAAIRGALDGTVVSLSGGPATHVLFDSAAPVFKTEANLVTTREQVVLYTVTAHPQG